LQILWCSSFSAAVLFNARVFGLLAYYFQNSLDLVTFIGEKVYVHKQVKLDAFGVPIKTKGQKAGEIALVLGAFRRGRRRRILRLSHCHQVERVNSTASSTGLAHGSVKGKQGSLASESVPDTIHT